MVMPRRFVMLTILVIIVSAVLPSLVFAAPIFNSLTLNPGSGCSSGSLSSLNVSLDVAAVRETGIVSLGDGTTLFQFDHSSGVGTSYNGSYGYGGWATVPDGTVISLYGTAGGATFDAADTVEWFAAYRCDTHELLFSCGGPFGGCPTTASEYLSQSAAPLVINHEACLNTFDGRLNNNGAFDCAAPIVLYHNADRLDVYGVGNGQSQVVFSIPDAKIVTGSSDEIASGNISGTGQPVKATLLGDGRLLFEAFYQDGKPYTIIYNPSGSPQVTNIAW